MMIAHWHLDEKTFGICVKRYGLQLRSLNNQEKNKIIKEKEWML